VYLVLLHIRRSRSGADFFKIIRSRKGAVDLLVAYCKQQDLDLLKDIYYQAGMPNQSAHVAVIEAYQHAVRLARAPPLHRNMVLIECVCVCVCVCVRARVCVCRGE
jgi:hypothetical protein